jgi:hypothetical protein
MIECWIVMRGASWVTAAGVFAADEADVEVDFGSLEIPFGESVGFRFSLDASTSALSDDASTRVASGRYGPIVASSCGRATSRHVCGGSPRNRSASAIMIGNTGFRYAAMTRNRLSPCVQMRCTASACAGSFASNHGLC